MKNINEYLNESLNSVVNENNHKLTGSKYTDIILNGAIDFFFNKYKLNGTKTRVMVTRIQSRTVGYIDIAKLKEDNKDNILVKLNKDFSVKFLIKFLSHELTHARQILDDKLWYRKEYIIWKNENFISLKEYKKLLTKSKFPKYKNLPWEKEAYDNDSKALKEFLSSNIFKTIEKEYKDDMVMGMMIESLK